MNKHIEKGVLLFLYEQNRAFNYQEMNKLFKKHILVDLEQYMLINTNKSTLEDIFNKIEDLNVGQFILTVEKYETILKYCVSNNIEIVNISYFDEPKKNTVITYINELLSELRRDNISTELKNLFLKSLITELRYLYIEQDLDISSITIKSPNNHIVTLDKNTMIFNKIDLDFIKEIIALFLTC